METRKKANPQCTPCLPSSCSLSKFLQMSYKPQTNRALMEVLTLPKAEQRARTAITAPQNDPCIPLPTPSLHPERGNHAACPTAALGGVELRHGGLASALALLSFACLQGRDLAGGLGRPAARGETKRAAIGAKRSGFGGGRGGWWPRSLAGPCFKQAACWVYRGA